MRIDRPASEGPPTVDAGDVAVLVRTNREADLWVRALAQAGVPARSDGGAPFLRRPEIVALYRFLQFLMRHPDDVALAEALATPYFEDVDLERREAEVLAYGIQRGTPLSDAYEARYPAHKERVFTLLRTSRTATVPQLLGSIEREFNLKQRYRAAGNDAAALAFDRLRDYARSRFDSDQALTLRTFLDILRRDMLLNPDLPGPGGGGPRKVDFVHVMTIHRAKGLEFSVVVIPGLEANRRSHRQPGFLVDEAHGLEVDLSEADIDVESPAFRGQWDRARQRTLFEEMRLFYVAVTRARRMVVMFGDDTDDRPPVSASAPYSWQHEVVAARKATEELGALFRPLVPGRSTAEP